MAEGQTFLSGFAQAFNQARARTEEQNAEQENTLFRYKMDNLMEQRKKREAKSAKETENAKAAKDLAAQMGDPDSAGMFYKEISNGVDYTELQKRVANGDYQKNTSYKAPTQTIKMPSGVAPETVQYDTDANPMQPEQKGLFAQGKQRSYDRMMDNVNKKIDQIDPSLRSGPADTSEFSTTTEDANSKYQYKPKNTYKLGDYGDALFKLSKAQQSGDPVAIREAQDEVKIHQRILSEKAAAEAKAQGKNVSKYFSINPDNSIGAQFAGERRDDGSLYNVSNPNGEQLVSGPVRLMDDKDIERYNKLVDDFGKKSDDYNAAATNFIGALDSSQKMAQILHDDPDAATTSSNVLNTLNNLSGEAQAAFKALNDMENSINAKAQSGNLEGIEKDIADYNKAAQKFVGSGFLSQGNQNKALNAAKFRSLQMQSAYAIAQANASDNKVSKNDLDNAMQIIGKSVEPKVIMQTVNQQMNGAFLKLASVQNTLDKNPSVVDFENRMRDPVTGKPLKTGLRGKRIGDQIQEMDIPPERKDVLMKYLSSVGKEFVDGQVQTQQSLQQTPPAPVPQQTGGVEFNGLLIPQEAVDILKSRNDDRAKKFFDQQFGPGAADRVLGGK
ncbi:hypothetical protein F67_I3_11_086 [Rhizobium phage RHph_I3_11]|nr:hypothetical protein F67_I3_11_086 [Rhizobium phage RHph_I3_11]